ncbi:S-layer homology domain-containing protein [Cohnella sp. LGH]|uniref:S-layer homology domain-containing protein n=1 Tax=Cohnella sp. LGH TaxID=1619153 RepID=UPI001ADC10E3|nr:S-layer homology domain-containing protein [Cohnella sp. LGH]QTH41382.1 S-layer homology domain-containing protein [Cohnella sp. LGH]
MKRLRSYVRTKIISKLVSIILSIALLGTMLPMIALAEEIVAASDIVIGTEAPVNGATLEDGTVVFGGGSVTDVKWSTDGTVYVAASGVFAQSTVYRTQYVLTANSSYVFDPIPGVYEKNGAKDITGNISNLGTGTFTAVVSTGFTLNDTLTIVITWPNATIEPSDISIGTIAPVTGAAIADGSNTFNKSAAVITWSDNGTVFSAAGGPFAANTYYYTKYVITANEGYAFDTTSRIYLDGAKSLAGRIAHLGTGYLAGASVSTNTQPNDTLTLIVGWESTDAGTGLIVIGASDISIGTLAPVPSGVAANGTNVFNHATVTYVEWSQETPFAYLDEGDPLVSGMTYATEYALQAANGYTFDSRSAYLKGGARDLSSRIANLGSGTFHVYENEPGEISIKVIWPRTGLLLPNDISIGTLAPVAEAAVADGVNTFNHATAEVNWSADNGATYNPASGTYTFVTTYKTKYVISAEAGYFFDSAAGVYEAGGAKALASRIANLGSGTYTAVVSGASNDTLTIVVTWPQTAAAPFTILDASGMSIGTIAPVTGANVADGTNAFAHTTASVTWSADNGATYASASGTFAPGKAYKTKVVLTADAGYAFNPTAGVYESISIPNLGSGTATTQVTTTSTSNDTLTITVTWPSTALATIAANELVIKTIAPITGASMADGANTFPHATASIAWSSDGGLSYAAASGAYAPNTVYRTKYVLTTDGGYTFDTAMNAYNAVAVENPGGVVLSADVSTSATANDTLTIEVTWPATGAATIVPADISIGTIAPSTGATQANGTNTFTHAAGAVTWSGDGGAFYAEADGTYAAAKVYKTKYVLTAMEGYAFDSTESVYEKDGARDLSGRIVNLGAGTFAATVSTASLPDDTLTVVVTWPTTGSAMIVPADISIGTAAPVTGAVQTNGNNLFNHASSSMAWSADNGVTYQPAGGTFAIGKSYRSKYVLIAAAGYQFNATAGAYNAIDIVNLGAGTFTAQVTTTSVSNDTLTIIVTWPATAITDSIKIDIGNTTDFRVYSGSTLIPEQGLIVSAESDYSITLVNKSIDTMSPSAPLTAAMVKSISVRDGLGNDVPMSVQTVLTGVAQNHPWSLKITIDRNATAAARLITITVNTDTARRIDIRNLIGFTNPTIEYSNPSLGSANPYEYGNYYYFLAGDPLKLQTTSSGLIPAGVQIVGKNTSKTSPVTNTLFDTTSYRFGYAFSMPSEPIFLSVTSTDGKAAHNIAVQATIPGVVSPTLSGGPQFVQATVRASATDYSGAVITVDPGSYNARMYKVTGVEVRSDLLNVALPVTSNGDGTYSFVMPFTDANVTVRVQKVVSNLIETEITTNANAELTVEQAEYYPGDTIKVQIVNKDSAKYVSKVQVYQMSGAAGSLVKQIQPTNPYDSRIDVGIAPYPSTAQLTAGSTIKVVAQFADVSIPVTTASAAQFSSYPVRASLNEPITFSFTPPSDSSKIYKPVVRFRDRLNNKTVYACTYVRSDPQDQTRSIYTCPAVTKNSIDLVELLYDAIDTNSPAAGGAPGATKLRNIASVSPNSRLAGLFKTINVYGTNMNGQGQVFIGTSPNPTLVAAITDATETSLVVRVPDDMLLSRTTDVTYYVSSNGVQRSVTIPAAASLSHTKFGYMAVVADSRFNHSVIVSESEKDLTQQLGDRTPVMTIKGSFTASASTRGEYVFNGTTTLNGGLAVYLSKEWSKLIVRDDLDGSVSLTMEDVNMTAGSFSIISNAGGSIRLDKGIEYISEYAKDEEGELEDPTKRNIEVLIRNQNKLIVVGSGMQAGITGATLLDDAVIFDGKIYFGMALPGSDSVGINLNIDRLQYGMDNKGNLSFQGVAAEGSFTPGTEISKKLLGGFGINGSAEGSIDTFNGNYAVAFDVDAKLANLASSLSLKRNGETGLLIPDSIKIIVGLENGIPVTPMTPIAYLTRVGGGVSGLADTISGNYKGIAPILILLTGDFEVGSLIPGAGLLEFSNVELAIGPSQIELSGNPTLLKMSIFDKFQAGIYVTQSSVSYQMQIAANILKNFSVILAGGNANLTYYRNNGFNLNGQLRGRLQVPEIDVGLFSIGPYTLLNSDVGLSNTNAFASFSLLGFGFKVNYGFGSGSVSVGRRSFSSAQSGPAGQTVYDENGAALGQINAFSNVRLVASSGGSPSLLRTFAVEPAISTNAEGTEHTVSLPAGLTEDYAVLVSADPDDLRILDPSGNPYGLTYPGTLDDGTPYYDDPNANAAVVSENTVMIRLGAEAGDWTIASGQPFNSSIIAIAPVPEIAEVSYDAGADKVSWDLSGLDTLTEDYQVEVRLSTDNGDDPNARSAGVLVHTFSVDAADVTDSAASGSYTFTEQDLNYLQSGQYYARVTLVGKPISDSSRVIPYSSRNAKQAMNVVNPLEPGLISGVAVSAGGNGTIHASWSAVSDADGYLVRLYDADGNAVISPLTYTDEIGSDGKPTGNRVAHAGRPIEYRVAASDEANGQISLRFGGIDSGAGYRLAVTPFAYADDAEMNSSYIYGPTTVTDVVDVPLVKLPVIHVKPSAGVIANDSLLGKVLTVNGNFTLDAATTYVSAEDGQTRDLNVKFTLWQSDGTLDENTNLPHFVQVYASGDYENRASVPITVGEDAGSTLLRIAAENDQGDVSEYGLAVHYNSLPPALFVETGTDGKIAADSSGSYRIAGSTVPYASVMDDRGNRTTADSEGQFSLSGTLSTGTQAYSTITATDSVGNVAQDDVSIVKSSQPANPGTDTGTNGGTNTGSGGAPVKEDGQTEGPTDNGTPAKRTFKDVHTEAAWAEEAIERAYGLGIVSGRTADLFAPNSPTRRDEAIAMLVRARKLAIGKQADLDAAAAHFADWHELAQWSRPYLAAAYANGLVTGKARQGKFYVNGASLVTRAEMTVLFQNAYRLTADGGNRKTFGDAIPSWAANSVDILSSNGVINGYPNSKFLPASNATRAEIVVMLMRLIDRQEQDAPAKDE